MPARVIFLYTLSFYLITKLFYYCFLFYSIISFKSYNCKKYFQFGCMKNTWKYNCWIFILLFNESQRVLWIILLTVALLKANFNWNELTHQIFQVSMCYAQLLYYMLTKLKLFGFSALLWYNMLDTLCIYTVGIIFVGYTFLRLY